MALLPLVVGSCATLGREIPTCEFAFVDVPISVVMELQALPGAEFGPCVNELAPGWTYHHMHHQSGRVSFWLDSDRLGDRFLTVTMEESCDPGGAAARYYPEQRIKRFVDAAAEVQPVDVVIVPLTGATVDYATTVGVDLAGVSVRGRPLHLRLDTRADDPSVRIAQALDEGDFVVAADVVDVVDNTVQLWMPGTDEIITGAELGDVVDAIEDQVEEGRYRATWYHLFSGGCVTFRFNAAGPGVERLATDVDAVVGFVDLADLARRAAQGGIILDESELE